jgi:nitric oxide reductase NorQ protein
MDGGNPYPKRTAKAKPATSEASPPEIKDDMVRMLAGQMAPLWDHRVRVESENLLSNIEPMISELSKKLDDSIEGITSRILKTPAASTLDPEAVKTLVKHCLANGEGEEIKKLVAKQGPAVFADILEKAARAIASTAPDDEAKAELTATYVPKPDPFYSWSDDLKETAELVNEIRSKPPEGAVNILLVGPTGAGKTEFSFQLAAMFKLPCIKMDCPNVREARDWFGVKGASGGRTYFRKSQFWLAVEAGNCVIILDEFNRVADHIRNPLMALLDHTRTAHVEEAGVLKVGPGTVFAATMNEGLDYSGTHSTDRAMKNRFCRRIELDYLPEDREVSVLCDKVPGIKKHHATMLVQVAGVIRSKAASFGGLSETLSTRQLLAAASDFVIKGADSFRSTVFNHFSSDGGDTSERKQVVNMFQLKGLLSK